MRAVQSWQVCKDLFTCIYDSEESRRGLSRQAAISKTQPCDRVTSKASVSHLLCRESLCVTCRKSIWVIFQSRSHTHTHARMEVRSMQQVCGYTGAKCRGRLKIGIEGARCRKTSVAWKTQHLQIQTTLGQVCVADIENIDPVFWVIRSQADSFKVLRWKHIPRCIADIIESGSLRPHWPYVFVHAKRCHVEVRDDKTLFYFNCRNNWTSYFILR